MHYVVFGLAEAVMAKTCAKDMLQVNTFPARPIINMKIGRLELEL
jgi:hypothetical protein